jgi:hypothetical protein
MEVGENRHKVPLDHLPTLLKESHRKPIQTRCLVSIHAFDHLPHLLSSNGSSKLEASKSKSISNLRLSKRGRLREQGIVEVNNMVANNSRIGGGHVIHNQRVNGVISMVRIRHLMKELGTFVPLL